MADLQEAIHKRSKLSCVSVLLFIWFALLDESCLCLVFNLRRHDLSELEVVWTWLVARMYCRGV